MTGSRGQRSAYRTVVGSRTEFPERFEKIIEDLMEKILSSSLNVNALVIIGSVAKGDYREDSDVDVVCIMRDKLDRKQRHQLMESSPERVQLIPLSEDELIKHFEDATTLAHSIQKGMVLYEKNGFLHPLLEKSLGLPSEKWMKDWFVHWLEFYFMGLVDLKREKAFHKEFCREECRCLISNNLARAAVKGI